VDISSIHHSTPFLELKLILAVPSWRRKCSSWTYLVQCIARQQGWGQSWPVRAGEHSKEPPSSFPQTPLTGVSSLPHKASPYPSLRNSDSASWMKANAKSQEGLGVGKAPPQTAEFLCSQPLVPPNTGALTSRSQDAQTPAHPYSSWSSLETSVSPHFC
jgi:hypothetical protein